MTSSHLTDSLMERARGGDRRAMNELFGRLSQRLEFYVRLRLGEGLRGKVEPGDVVQETYLEVLRSFASFEPQGPGAFARWVFRIALHQIHALADHHGAEKRGGSARLGPLPERSLPAAHTGPSTACARQEEVEGLYRALAGLEERQRQAVLCRYFEGRSLAETAAELGCGQATVSRQLAKALARLGRRLQALEAWHAL